MMDADRRERLRQAKADVRELERPEREARKIATAQARRNREKRVGTTAPGQRKPRVKEPAYLNWIRGLSCICCGKAPRSQAAHIRAGYAEDGWRPTGMQEKPDDRRTAPLCHTCHLTGPKAQHASQERAWWAERGIYPPDLCAALSAAYDARQDGQPIIAQFAPARRGAQP